MKLYKMRLKARTTMVFDFIRFAGKNKIDIYISYSETDMFDELVIMYICVPSEAVAIYEGKYGGCIIERENA